MSSTRFNSIGLFLGLMLVVGCGGGDLPTLSDLNDSNIRRLHSCYNIYMNAHQYRGPKDKQELLDFLTSDNTAKVLLKRMDVTPDQLEGIFTSERDGEPFKVRYGLSGIADHAIVFESVGIEGKRLVAFSRPRELDTEEYDGYFSGEIEPAAPAPWRTWWTNLEAPANSSLFRLSIISPH